MKMKVYEYTVPIKIWDSVTNECVSDTAQFFSDYPDLHTRNVSYFVRAVSGSVDSGSYQSSKSNVEFFHQAGGVLFVTTTYPMDKRGTLMITNIVVYLSTITVEASR